MLDRKFDSILNESYDYFKSQGVSILGKGYEEIAYNPALFESYTERLTEGASANGAVTMKALMENTNKVLLTESSLTGIQPISSLAMPVIRKLWPKFGLKDALDTQIAKQPRISIAYTKPYMQKGDEEKIYLPNGMRDGSDLGKNMNARVGKTYVEFTDQVVNTGAAIVVDKTEDPSIKITTTGSAAKRQPCDELIITAVTRVDGESAETEEKIYNTKLSVVGTRVLDLANGQLIVVFDAKGKVTLSYIGDTEGTKVKVSGKIGVSTEYNEDSYSIGYDIHRQDIDIPSGQHINAPLPIEQFNDAMAMYQINGLKEVVDIMTNFFAQKLDLEILDFIETSFANQPNNKEFAGYGDADEFGRTFDCIPQAGFAGSNAAWREELKRVISYLATKIKNATYLQTGRFVVVGNPIDTDLISNVDWNFRAGQGNSIDGVDVDYAKGSYIAGTSLFQVISSPNVTEGALYIVFLPSSESQMTYKYYPYTFSTEMGYIDPNRSKVPSIMMTKRDAKYEFIPACGCVTIMNNTGSPYRTHIPTVAPEA